MWLLQQGGDLPLWDSALPGLALLHSLLNSFPGPSMPGIFARLLSLVLILPCGLALFPGLTRAVSMGFRLDLFRDRFPGRLVLLSTTATHPSPHQEGLERPLLSS